MTDAELLGAAAKAAGLGYHSFAAPKELANVDNKWGMVRALGYGMVSFWNPLTDDGDAFRLAVKLNIIHGNPGMRLSIDWSPADDPYAATRRAITRAAALAPQPAEVK